MWAIMASLLRTVMIPNMTTSGESMLAARATQLGQPEHGVLPKQLCSMHAASSIGLTGAAQRWNCNETALTARHACQSDAADRRSIFFARHKACDTTCGPHTCALLKAKF